MSNDINEVVKGLGTAFEEFKKANDQRLDEIKNQKREDPVLSEKLGRIDAFVADTQKRLEEAETILARKNKFKADYGDEYAEKASAFEAQMAKARGIPAKGDFAADDLKAYRKSFVQWMRKGDELLDLDSKKALSVGSDPDGGYTVEPDTSGRIVQKIYETSPVRQVASVQAIGTDSLEGLYDLDEAAAEWVEETQSRSQTDTPKLGQWRIPVHELSAKPSITQKLLDDSMIDIEGWLADKVADRFSRTENAAFVAGDGVGKPRGFLTYPDGTNLPGQIQQFPTGESGGFDDSGDGGDVLMDVIYGLKQGYRSGARWMMPRSVTAEVRKLKDAEGRYLWQPGIAAGQPATLLGYGVIEFEDMPDLDNGSLSMAFGNMGEAYQIVDRIGIRVLRDPYTAKPRVLYYTTKRTGGDVVNFEAIKLIRFGS
jgi:HK97 family phage major capsid protein